MNTGPRVLSGGWSNQSQQGRPAGRARSTQTRPPKLRPKDRRSRGATEGGAQSEETLGMRKSGAGVPEQRAAAPREGSRLRPEDLGGFPRF